MPRPVPRHLSPAASFRSLNPRRRTICAIRSCKRLPLSKTRYGQLLPPSRPAVADHHLQTTTPDCPPIVPLLLPPSRVVSAAVPTSPDPISHQFRACTNRHAICYHDCHSATRIWLTSRCHAITYQKKIISFFLLPHSRSSSLRDSRRNPENLVLFPRIILCRPPSFLCLVVAKIPRPARRLPSNSDNDNEIGFPKSLLWTNPQYKYHGPPPIMLNQGKVAVQRIVSPPPANDNFPPNMFRIVLLPYLACRNKSHENFKTTTLLMADMHHPDHISYPTFEIMFTESAPHPDPNVITPLIEELIQRQWGSSAKRPVCLFADRAWTYHPYNRTLVVAFVVPFPTQETYHEDRYSEFLNRITA